MATRHPLRWGLTYLLTMALPGATGAQDAGEKGSEDEPPDAPDGKVWLMQNIGGHTGPIREMVFARSGKQLPVRQVGGPEE
jgi:hypothetical protein